MSINQVYDRCVSGLRQLRPQERITRRRNLAWLMVGILMSRSVHLSRIALKIPGAAKEVSTVRRLERLLDNPAIHVRRWYEPIARSWVESAAKTTGEVRLILDTTKVGMGHRLLIVSLAFRRRAIPLVWTWQRGAKGHSAARTQLALLHIVRQLIPEGVPVLLVGDTEFEAGDLQKALVAWRWQYVLRQKPNNQVKPSDQAAWQRLGDLVTGPGQSVWVAPAWLTLRYAQRVNLLAHWQVGEKEPWLLATTLSSAHATRRAYQRRMWIEEMFGDWKGHGFDLESSHLRHFARLSRLTLAVALLYVCIIRTGVTVIKKGLRHHVDRKDRRDLSLFQIGLRWLERCWKNSRPFSISLGPPGY